jgi:hypothetical protein
MRLAILVASGFGKVPADAVVKAVWKTITFFDDAWPEVTVNGYWEVKGGMGLLMKSVAEYDGVVVPIGNNHMRLEKQQDLSSAGAVMGSIIHPSVVAGVPAQELART